MKLASIERYRFYRESGRLVIRLGQWRNAVGFSLFVSISLWMGWVFMSGHPLSWEMWRAVLVLVLLTAILVRLHRETITLEGSELRRQGSLRREQRVDVGPSVQVRVEQQLGQDQVFPFLVHFCDLNGEKTGVWLQFRKARSVDRCLEVLKQWLPVTCEDLRGQELLPEERLEIEIQRAPKVLQWAWRALAKPTSREKPAPPSSPPAQWIGLMWPLLGAFFCLLGIGFGLYSLSQSVGTVSTAGAVVEVMSERDSEGDLAYRPVVEYEVGGRRYKVKAMVASSFWRLQIGERVKILYRPEQPATAYIDSFLERWLVPLIASTFGGLFAVLGYRRFRYGRLN